MNQAVTTVHESATDPNEVVVQRLGRARAALRCAGALSWTAICGVGVMVSVVAWPFSRLHTGWRRAVTRVWGRGVVRMVGMRVTVTGRPPTPPYVLVSNHLSYLDIILLASQAGCNFVSRHDVRDWPGFGTVAWAAGTLFVDRGRKRDAVRAMREMERHLERGAGVALFPEGTSTRGDRVYPMKATMLELASRGERPVYHATISYQTPLGAPPPHRLVCWWGDMTFGGHFLELLRWPYFDASVHFGEEPIRERDRKQLADRLRHAIAERFVPVVEKSA